MKARTSFTLFFEGKLIALILTFYVTVASAQILPPNRMADWKQAGIQGVPFNPCYIIHVNDHGADSTGISPTDAALQSAINLLSGDPGIIYFSQGTYLFQSTISLPSNCVLRGAGSNLTQFHFNLGGIGDCIQAIGMNVPGSVDTLVASAFKNDNFIRSSFPQIFEAGDYIRLFMDDIHLVNDSWAEHTVMHLTQILSISGDTLFLDQELRHTFSTTNYARIQKINPVLDAGVENLKIKRLDATATQSKNILFKRAVNCWIKGVESEMCNYGHFVLNMSAYCEISGSYTHQAFGYGSGGKAYGVVLEAGTNLARVENNIFNHLRHSILLQSGANGNVIAYNYSIDPYWTEFFSDAGGDIVLHGNYPFLNLFEGNVVQNIRIDASHGENGPFNTFFRNRAELWGFIMSNSPASDSQNVVGLEVTNPGFFLGNYSLSGMGHFTYGNNILGTNQPPGTIILVDTTYAYATLPDFLMQNPSWPFIGYPNMMNAQSIPARTRFISGIPPFTVPKEAYDIQDGSIYWTGCLGTNNWGEAGNWSSLSIPDLASNVVIRMPVQTQSQMPNISSDSFSVHSLIIQFPGKLTVINPGYLEVQ
jgi:hypothetical protein